MNEEITVETTLELGNATYSITHYSGELRWVKKSIIGLENKLQQAFVITTYAVNNPGVPISSEIEWRDVPICEP